jgi:hypothetical protein
METMEDQKTIPTAFGRSNVEMIGTRPIPMTARRFCSLDVGDWSTISLRVTLVGLLLALI